MSDIFLRFEPWPKTRPGIVQSKSLESVVKREDLGDYHRNGGHWIRFTFIDGQTEWWDFNAIKVLEEREFQR